MNSPQPLITVIVPAYNVESDIGRCVKSIQAQSYRNMEIILIDDGSPDNCGQIFEQMKLTDERIVVIHKENGGLSDARNVALDIMHGTYVTFVDGDDYIHQDYISKLYDAICKYNVPIAICDEQRFLVDSDGDVAMLKCNNIKKEMCILTAEAGIVEFLYQRKYDTSAWGKLYLSSLFAGIRYPKGKQFEDLATTYKLFLKVQKVVFINEKMYMYQVRKTSQMRSAFNLGKLDGISIADNVRDEIKNISDKLYKACNCRCLSMYFHVFLDIPVDEYKELQNEIWKKIKETRFKVLLDIKARKKAKIAALLSYFGKECCRYVFGRVQQK